MDKENGIIFSLNKLSPDICDNMDEPGGHYAKWNKPHRDKYFTASFICKILKKSQTYRNKE